MTEPTVISPGATNGLARWWKRLPAGVRDLVLRGWHSAWQAVVTVGGPALLVAVAAQNFTGIPWAGIAISAAVAAAVSLLTSLVSWGVKPQFFWQDALVRLAKTLGAVFLGQLTATGFDALHVDWRVMLTSGLSAGLLAFARTYISVQGKGGPESYNSSIVALRTLGAHDAAVVGDGTTVTDASWHLEGAGPGEVADDFGTPFAVDSLPD